MKTDVLIVGSGVSGLYCALRLPREMKITIITKSDLESSDSFLAQGGICVLKDESDYDAYFEDTMRAGHYENDKKSVDIMLRSSQQVIGDLVECGVLFERDENGGFLYTREGATFAEEDTFPQGYHRQGNNEQTSRENQDPAQCHAHRKYGASRHHRKRQHLLRRCSAQVRQWFSGREHKRRC